MNWLEELEKIYSKLESAGREDIKKELYDAQLSGGTGGEIFLIVSEKLKQLKEHNDVYSLIKKEIDSILQYGIKIGYL